MTWKRNARGPSDCGVHIGKGNNGPTEHQLGNDEQRNGEVNDPHTVEQQRDDESEHIGARGDREQGPGVGRKVSWQLENGV